MLGVVVSTADTASELIGEQLRSTGDWTAFQDPSNEPGFGRTGYRSQGITIREFDDLHLYLDNVATAFDDPSVIIFASRHSGDTGPLLSVHFTGNIGAAEYGGSPGTLATAAPNTAYHALHCLQQYRPPDYEVTLESTHHGPSEVGAPSMFLEIGSDTPQWEDRDAATAAAKTVRDIAETSPTTDRTLISLGEGHYAPRATRIVSTTDWRVGHIAPDWALDDLSPTEYDTIFALVTKSAASYALITAGYDDIATHLRDQGVRIVSETWVQETNGVALDRVELIETQLGPIEDGVRFGELSDRSETIELTEIPTDFLTTVLGVDRAATKDAVAATTIAYDTTEGGTKVSGPIAVPPTAGLEPVIEALLDVAATGYDTVVWDGEHIKLTETRFDPQKAHARGVPEGPLYGQLANGETVEIDGKSITPEEVMTETTHSFHL